MFRFTQERSFYLAMLAALVVAVAVTFAALIHSWADLTMSW